MVKKGGVLGSIVAAVVGAAAGATAVVLSDKKNRQFLKKKVEEGGEKLEEVGKMVEDVVGRGKKSVSKRKAAKKTVKRR